MRAVRWCGRVVFVAFVLGVGTGFGVVVAGVVLWCVWYVADTALALAAR